MAAVAAQLQLEARPLGFGMFTWANSLLNVGATLGLVVVFGHGWEGRVLGQVIAAAAVGFAAVVVLVRMVGPGAQWSWALAKNAVLLGAPAVPYALLDRVIQFADRVLITAIAGIEQAGLYTLGSQVSGLMTRGATSINLAWQPWLFERLGEGTPKAARRVVLAFYVAASAMLGLGVSLWLAVRWLFPLLIGDRFASAVTLLPWLCIGLALRGIAGLLSGLIVYSGKTGALTQIAAATALVHVIGLATLLNWQGTEGAAQSAFIAYACNLSFVWWTARRLVPLAGL
jgi:O-antigen/teichoic acid export membrane protein